MKLMHSMYWLYKIVCVIMYTILLWQDHFFDRILMNKENKADAG